MIFSLPQPKGWGNSRVVVMPGLRLRIGQPIYFSKTSPSLSGERDRGVRFLIQPGVRYGIVLAH
jgi:hypothetical protein